MYLTKLIELVRENPEKYEGRKYKLIVDKDFNLEMEVAAGKIKCNNKSESEIRIVGINDTVEEIKEAVDIITAAKDYLETKADYKCDNLRISELSTNFREKIANGKWYKEDKSE